LIILAVNDAQILNNQTYEPFIYANNKLDHLSQ